MATNWEFRAYDKEQFAHFIRGYYNVDNSVQPLSDDRLTRAYFRGASSEEFAQAFMSVSTPLRLVADTGAFMLVSCRSGGLHMRGSRGDYEIAANASLCVSPGILTDATTAPGWASTVTHLDTDRVHRLCSVWLGSELDDPLKLDEGAFAPLLHEQWSLVTRLFDMVHSVELAGDRAFGALEEYAVSLLLHNHPHNYAKYLERRETVSARIASDAHAFIHEHAERPITPTDVAEFLGCSLSALGRGFREHMGISLRECLYAARVARTHGMLASGTADSYHDILRQAGFMNISRFEAAYRQAYGRTPAETWERHASGQPKGSHAGGLSAEKVERLRLHILSSLSKPLRVSELAAVAGMSTTRFNLAFRRAFGMSPAQYVLHERLNWAHWLLTSTDKGVAAIAAETGFSSQAHLTTALRQYHGVTPGEMRTRSRIPRRSPKVRDALSRPVET